MAPTREEVVREMQEVQRDLESFSAAYRSINGRIREMDLDLGRQDKFMNWAGTQAAMNVLTLCIVRCEGLLEDYRKALESMELPSSLN